MPADAPGWRQVEIAGHACDFYEPAQPNEYGYALIYLHGVHQARLVDNATYTQLFAKHGLRAIAPMTGRSWWADRLCSEFDPRITPEQYVLRHVIPYLGEQHAVTPPAIGLFGTSMGGQGALRMAFKHPNTFPIVAALAPAIDYQIRYDEYPTMQEMYADPEAVRQDTATLHVHPLNWPRNTFFACDPNDWPWIESAQRLQMKLSALGIPFEADMETTGGGHGFAYYDRMAETTLDFIIRKLEAERRRVV